MFNFSNASDFVLVGIMFLLLAGLFIFIVKGARGSRVPQSDACNGRTYRRDFGATNIKSGMSADEAYKYWSKKQTHDTDEFSSGYEYNNRF